MTVSEIFNEGVMEHLRKHAKKYVAGAGALGATTLGLSASEHHEKAEDAENRAEEAREDAQHHSKFAEKHELKAKKHLENAKESSKNADISRKKITKHKEEVRLYGVKEDEKLRNARKYEIKVNPTEEDKKEAKSLRDYAVFWGSARKNFQKELDKHQGLAKKHDEESALSFRKHKESLKAANESRRLASQKANEDLAQRQKQSHHEDLARMKSYGAGVTAAGTAGALVAARKIGKQKRPGNP